MSHPCFDLINSINHSVIVLVKKNVKNVKEIPVLELSLEGPQGIVVFPKSCFPLVTLWSVVSTGLDMSTRFSSF